MKEFWNNQITEASWRGLQTFSKEIKFVLIGGWAIYFYSNLQKSKDIDVIIDYDALSHLSSKYSLVKNDRLKKYEIKFEGYDIDIYLPDYSKLVIPPKDIINEYSVKHQGFTLPTPEALMCLKLGAAKDRKGSIKGDKDSIDILGLLFYSDVNISTFSRMVSRYGLEGYLELLISILSSFSLRNLRYLNLNEHEFSRMKREYVDKLRKLK